MSDDAKRPARLERSLATVRLGAVPFAAAHVLVAYFATGHFSILAWLITAALALGAGVLYSVARLDLEPRSQRALGVVALAFDTAIFGAYALVSGYEPAAPTRIGLLLVVVEGSVRYAAVGALVMTVVTAPLIALSEWLRSEHQTPSDYRWDTVAFQIAIAGALGLIVGVLVRNLDEERLRAEERAAEAEGLRDELGRRADLLDAANRCARALSSSLDLDEAFVAFIRELRGLVPFDRVAIVTAEAHESHTIAATGYGDDSVFPPGTRAPVAGSLLAEIVAGGHTIERQEMDPPGYPEEEELLRLGLRARVAAPVLTGVRTIGMLSVSRTRANSFSRDEVDLTTLLGRLVGSAVQNIRAYDAERATVEELRSLSALRADFVSLVSHELRSPMAAVIGSARTLQLRWRELTPEQREAFLALIADETTRLASLVGDVLDTSRIEAGTFSYSFGEVAVQRLLRDAVATAEIGQDEVPVELEIEESLPTVRGDAERLRQVISNLLDNAIKYSPHGAPVDVRAWSEDGHILVTVSDEGPGIALEHQKLIFEKFGRAETGAKPGTGLGLFIARSIAEAHGGSLAVDSVPGGGTTFRLELPLHAH